ncbi:acyl-CoA dehydrogenase family protein [Arhodomonas sp. AD133]|uniref:acyl-CoA dehydrogenase family protein n=1 Tax=Arhodomonas sp. AD133 TaxID=3415009 RepID=UPI003EBDBC1E
MAAARALNTACDSATQVFGAEGLSELTPLSGIYRTARATRIMEWHRRGTRQRGGTPNPRPLARRPDVRFRRTLARSTPGTPRMTRPDRLLRGIDR